MAVTASESEDRCVPGGAVVGGEVRSGRVRRHRHIGLVQWSGGNEVICFRMPAQTEGTAYSVVGGDVLCKCWCTLSVEELEKKREVGANGEEV